MYKKLMILILITFTFSCATPIQVQNPFVMPDTEDIIRHERWPDGIKPFMKDKLETLVYEVDGETKDITGFKFDDYILFSLWLQEQERYRKGLEQLVCDYRKELKEERCIKYENATTSK